MDIFLPILGLLMIMAIVVGGTIKINTLLISKSLTKILLIIASILAIFMIILLPIHYFIGTLTWGVFFTMLLIIAILFLLANFVPKLPIVSYLREIHLSNLEDSEEQALREAE
ncbi:MAG: hypothetical protein HOD35_01675 [Euryarchaeota archaeon]|nr:hypothetical protein [Euryarchaeota archaeon]